MMRSAFLQLLFLTASAVCSGWIDCTPDVRSFDTPRIKRKCTERQCNFNEKNRGPMCTFPSGTGYKLKEKVGRNYHIVRGSDGVRNPFGDDLELMLSHRVGGSTLSIKISTKQRTLHRRFDPMKHLRFSSILSSSTEKLTFKAANDSTGMFYFLVERESTKTKIWDTSVGGLLFAEQYIQISTLLPTENIYGFGENAHRTFKHDFSKYKTWGMFARDEPPEVTREDGKNLYGTHPFYVGIEKDGKAHGVFILNSNAQDISTMPGPQLVYRSIGGFFEIFFFPGPEPEAVIKQYLALIGKPFLPSYASLGFQIGHHNFKDLEALKTIVANISGASIPFDTVFLSSEYTSGYKVFTLHKEKWKDLPSFAQELHNSGRKLYLTFDPAVQVEDKGPFKNAIEKGAKFIEWENEKQVQKEVREVYPFLKDSKILLGVLWSKTHVAYPDFLDSKTCYWWLQELKSFHEKVNFDGVIITMNEPTSEDTNKERLYFDDERETTKPLKCSNDSLNNPKYETHNVYVFRHVRRVDGISLVSKTICLNAVMAGGKEKLYDTKNLYGFAESVATKKAMELITGKRGIVISRSTFSSNGRFAGHWLGDNYAAWDDMKASIIGMLEFNMFGIPYVGADICGFSEEATEELCLRWQQLGAFYPLSRNRNALSRFPQHPTVWESVAKATLQANTFRYSYLLYLYSLHFVASKYGGTVVRPVFFEFPNDNETYTLDTQFMWGPAMMVAPVLEKGSEKVDVYLPLGIWYSLRPEDLGRKYGSVKKGAKWSFQARKSEMIPVFARGGHVIPYYIKAAKTTAELKKGNIGLQVALDKHGRANGFFYVDDDEEVVTNIETHQYCEWKVEVRTDSDSRYLKTTLTITQTKHTDSSSQFYIPKLEQIGVLGYTGDATSVNVNAQTYGDQNTTSLTSVTGSATKDKDHHLLMKFTALDISGQKTEIIWRRLQTPEEKEVKDILRREEEKDSQKKQRKFEDNNKNGKKEDSKKIEVDEEKENKKTDDKVSKRGKKEDGEVNSDWKNKKSENREDREDRKNIKSKEERKGNIFGFNLMKSPLDWQDNNPSRDGRNFNKLPSKLNSATCHIPTSALLTINFGIFLNFFTAHFCSIW